MKTKIIIKTNEVIFEGIPRKINVGRYHSWQVVRDGLPENISILAEDKNGTIMAVSDSDSSKKIYGLQFHPESIMTEYGQDIIQNFLNVVYC